MRFRLFLIIVGGFILVPLTFAATSISPYAATLSNNYGFTVDLPETWQDAYISESTIESDDALGSYVSWDFNLPTSGSDQASYGRVFSLHRYANPDHLSVVAWQNATSTTITPSPTAIATDGDTIFAYTLDTTEKQYRDFPDDSLQPLADAVNIVAFFRFIHTFDNFFSDVTADNPNRRAIEELSVAGIIAGYSDGTFRPDTLVNRAELAKILVEGLGIHPDSVTYHDCFPDVTDAWYAPAVCYAQNAGWVQGYPDGQFHPEKTVNKVEALKMVVAAHGFPLASNISVSTATLFSDTPVTEWYAPYVKTALDRGLIEELEDGLYEPDSGRTRGAIAEIIFRVRVAQSMGVQEYLESYRDKVTTGI